MFFSWFMRDSKFPLVVLNNAQVWMVSARPETSKSSRLFNNPLVTVPKPPITIVIIVTCMFHSFFIYLARSRYLFFLSHSLSFIQPRQQFRQLLLLLLLLLLLDRDKGSCSCQLNFCIHVDKLTTNISRR